VADHLLRALPPLANDWVLGVASAVGVIPDRGEALARAVAAGDDATDLLEPIVAAVATANSTYFRFELDGLLDADEPRLVTLTSGRSTLDLGLGLRSDRPTRKLTALLVVEVEGAARLVVAPEGKTIDLVPGTVVVLPSYCAATLDAPDDASATLVAVHALGRSFR